MMNSPEPRSTNTKLFYALSALAAFLSLGLSCTVGVVLYVFFTQDSFLAQNISVPSLDRQTHLGALIVAIGASIVTLPGIILAIIAARKSTQKADAIIAILVVIIVATILAVNIAIWSLDVFTNFEPFYL